MPAPGRVGEPVLARRGLFSPGETPPPPPARQPVPRLHGHLPASSRLQDPAEGEMSPQWRSGGRSQHQLSLRQGEGGGAGEASDSRHQES